MSAKHFAIKSPEGQICLSGASAIHAIGLFIGASHRLTEEDQMTIWRQQWSSRGYTVVPVSLTELSEPKEDSHG